MIHFLQAAGFYFGFMLERQIHFRSTLHSYCSHRFVFPKDLKTMRLLINNREILWKNGLTGLSGDRTCFSRGGQELYSYMLGKRLISRGIDEMFTPDVAPTDVNATKLHYNQAAFIDLSDTHFKDGDNLTILCEWKDTLSPKETIVMSVFVTEYALTRDGNKRWSTELPSANGGGDTAGRRKRGSASSAAAATKKRRKKKKT